MNKIHPFNRIEQDNNAILENVYSTLEHALEKQDVYEVTCTDENGYHPERMTREQYLVFVIECALEELQDHNYFYQKEGIDKYK